jgi:SAM-dependent methyltransferase
MAGELVEAEHLARYHWAAPAVAGARVLDAGCGMAYGSALLADAGAAEVVGIDRAAAVLEAARAEAPAKVELVHGELTDLPFSTNSFDVVVCFEVIEHVKEWDVVLAELHRVLTDDGVLMISSPNRDVYVPGNPHHVHEFLPDELREALGRRFARVELRRQHNWVTSAVMDDDQIAHRGRMGVDGAQWLKTTAVAPGREVYTIALATNGSELPALPMTLAVTGDVEVRRWLDLYREQQEVLGRQTDQTRRLEAELAELPDLRRRLIEAEATANRVVADQSELEILRIRMDLADRVMADLKSSVSWRMTAPLRAGKRLARALLRRS